MVNLKKIQDNVVFNQTQMMDALEAVGESHQAKWNLSEVELDEFKTRVARRIRTMCHHFMAAFRKQKRPNWVGQILAMEGVSPL